MDAAFIATMIGVAVAALTFIKALFEYSKQNRQKRAEHFMEMRRRFKDNESFSRICALLEYCDPKLEEVPFAEKRDFLGFFQELAIQVNSRLIRKEVAHYMFGYYAILCWNCESFWHRSVNKLDVHWRLFQEFAAQMQSIEKQVKESGFNMRKLRL